MKTYFIRPKGNWRSDNQRQYIDYTKKEVYLYNIKRLSYDTF